MSLLSKDEVIKKRQEHMIPCMGLFYDNPLYITHAKGQYIYDEQENKYLDMLGGFSVMAVGHSNEYVTNRMKLQMDKVIHSTQVFLNEPIVELAEKLNNLYSQIKF